MNAVVEEPRLMEARQHNQPMSVYVRATDERRPLMYMPAIHQPLTRAHAFKLIDASLFDEQYGPMQQGLRGCYHAAIEGDQNVFEKHWTVYVDGSPIAFCGIRPYVEGDVANHLHVYVHPDFRGQGIGTWLVDRAKSIGCPVLQAHNTKLGNGIFEKHAINQIYPPSQIDRDFKRTMRTLDPKHTWVVLGADGKPDMQMVSSDIRDLLQDLYDRVKKQDPRA